MAFERDFYKITRKNGRIVQPRHLYPVLTGDQLLADPRRKTLLKKIKQSCGLEELFYEKAYLNLVLDFAEFVQILPSVSGGKIGGLLNDGLERAAFAAQFAFEDKEKKSNLRFIYAVFSAALLDRIGRIITQQKIFMAEHSGTIITEWNPLNRDHTFMRDQGEFYKILNLAGGWTVLTNYITVAFADRLMPTEGYLWLAQDKILFQMWLATLAGDQANGGEVADLLLLVEKHIEELRTKKMELPPIEVEEEPLRKNPVEDFIEWINVKVKDGDIIPNKKYEKTHGEIHVIDNNKVIVSEEAVKQFCEENHIAEDDLKQELDKVMDTKGEVTYTEQVETKVAHRDLESFFGGLPPLHERTAEKSGVLLNLNMLTFGAAPPTTGLRVEENLQAKALQELVTQIANAAGEKGFTPRSN